MSRERWLDQACRAARLTSGPQYRGATAASRLVRTTLVWDQLMPATETCGSIAAHLAMLERMRAQGVNTVSLTMAYDPEDCATALARLTTWRREIAAAPDKFRLLLTPQDAVDAQSAGQLAVGFHFQGASPFGQNLDLVEAFYAQGVRAAILAHNRHSAVGGGCHAPNDPGLSPFGRKLVERMQKVGIMVDLSHCGYRTARDACEAATRPVFVTHANPSARFPHERNIPNELARACAATGGLVGACGVGIFLRRANDMTKPLFEAVDHWVQLLGADHVGLGLDIVSDPQHCQAAVKKNTAQWPAHLGYHTQNLQMVLPENLVRLTERMLAAGYSEADCAGILGGNWARVAAEAWRPAAI